jgi:hypothetical protein
MDKCAFRRLLVVGEQAFYFNLFETIVGLRVEFEFLL